MRSPQVKIAVLVLALVAATAGLLVYAMLQQAKVSCEVCVTFRGRTQCRTAMGPGREEAIRGATDNACGFLASGMADGISCSNTPPTSITCED